MNFDKESKSDFFGRGGGGGGGGGTKSLNLNSVCQKQNVKCGKIQKSNHLHTVERVVQSTF